MRTWRCPRRGRVGAPPRREREVEREKEREKEGRRGRGTGRGASGGGGAPREERERDEREGRPGVGGSLFLGMHQFIWGELGRHSLLVAGAARNTNRSYTSTHL